MQTSLLLRALHAETLQSELKHLSLRAPVTCVLNYPASNLPEKQHSIYSATVNPQLYHADILLFKCTPDMSPAAHIYDEYKDIIKSCFVKYVNPLKLTW